MKISTILRTVRTVHSTFYIADVCTECCYARMQERAQHVENYRYGTIYVRKITKDHTEKDIEQVLNDVSIVFLFFLVLFQPLNRRD